MASRTPAATTSRANTSSSRSTCTNSRLPGLPMRASSKRRRIANTSGKPQPAKGAGLVKGANLALQQRQIVQRVVDEVLPLIGAPVLGDHRRPARNHHALDIPADQHFTMAVGGWH